MSRPILGGCRVARSRIAASLLSCRFVSVLCCPVVWFRCRVDLRFNVCGLVIVESGFGGVWGVGDQTSLFPLRPVGSAPSPPGRGFQRSERAIPAEVSSDSQRVRALSTSRDTCLVAKPARCLAWKSDLPRSHKRHFEPSRTMRTIMTLRTTRTISIYLLPEGIGVVGLALAVLVPAPPHLPQAFWSLVSGFWFRVSGFWFLVSCFGLRA